VRGLLSAWNTTAVASAQCKGDYDVVCAVCTCSLTLPGQHARVLSTERICSKEEHKGRREGAHAMVISTTAQSDLLGAPTWRCIGPFRGGRVVAVAGDPIHPMTFYFGACAGGVWKTTDGGTYWAENGALFRSDDGGTAI
jgi:hypothetical protein